MTEATILKQCKRFLDTCEQSGLLQWIRNNTGAVRMGKGSTARWVSFGKKGSADLIIAARGRILFAEVKAPGKYLSREQKAFAKRCASCGNPFVVIRSVGELQEAIRVHLGIDVATEMVKRRFQGSG